MNLTYGTAQGSIFGPLLIILYVNDLFVEIEKQKSVLMYADDTLFIFIFYFFYYSRLHNTICSSSRHSINVIEIYIECV